MSRCGLSGLYHCTFVEPKYSYQTFTLYQPMMQVCFMSSRKPIRIYMGGLILGVNTLYRLFSFFKLFPMVGKGLTCCVCITTGIHLRPRERFTNHAIFLFPLSPQTEDVQQLKSLASRSTNRCPLRKESPLAHLKIAFLADFQEEGHENGMTPSTFDLCTQALESLLGRSQSVSVDSLGVPMEIVYPDCNVKVSVAMEDIGGLLEKSMPKLPFVPDLLLCLFNSLTIFDSIPQLTNVLSPNLWERCVILVPNDPVAIYAKRPFIKLLKQAGICPQTVAKIPFVLLPSADPDSPLHRIRRTSEIFTTCIERAHCASKLALVSLNKCRVSAAFRVNYTQLPANLAECPIALTNWQAERVLSQTETRVQHKCCKLTIGALKLTAPIMGKLCSTMV